MKQMEVTILGQVYMLGCPEGGEQMLRTAVAAVDKEMTHIRDAGKVKARERVAVLAALNLAYQLAEQAAQQAAQHSQHVAKTETNPSRKPTAAAPAATVQELEALLRRIDDALSEDGQLL